MDIRTNIEIVMQKGHSVLIKDNDSASGTVHYFSTPEEAHAALGYMLDVDVLKEAAVLVSKNRTSKTVVPILGLL